MRRLASTALVLALAVGAATLVLRGRGDAGTGAQPLALELAADEVVELHSPAADLVDRAPRTQASDPLAEAAAEPPACPDLEQLVAQQVAQLRERSRSLDRDWVADCATRATQLDGHCANGLLAMGIDPARDREQRLAALSLAASAEHSVEASLDPATCAWLWARLEVPTPFSSPDWRPDPLGEDCARVAALCLAWLGGPVERVRLVEALSEPDGFDFPHIFALVRARDDDVAEPLVAALERGGLPCARVQRLLAASKDRRAFDFTPQQTERAVRALLDGADAGGPLICGTGRSVDSPPVDHPDLNLALLSLDPRATAEHWTEHIDAGRLQPRSARWAVLALCRRGEAGDLQRVGMLATSGTEEQRVAVALRLLEFTQRDEAYPALRSTCLDQLLAIARDGASPRMRQRALLMLQRAPDLGVRQVEVQALAAASPDLRDWREIDLGVLGY